MRYSDFADYCCIVGNVVLVCAKRQRVADFQALVKGSAEHGFVVVSFGAGVKYLSHDIAHKLAGALARLPQLVIWR
ncbi:UDP glycosyltransferase 8 [Xenoophorus captivus]|uniref:UDP glycosyltransferase 8 n=1 Tax=Xenoophorus captivus TaxID=1517983 RepID=A0ABV0QSB3_9TELE